MKICGKLWRKVASYCPDPKAAIEYLSAERFVRETARLCGLDADRLIAEAEEMATTTTYTHVEALYWVALEAMKKT